jgi:hypothetical protein
VRGDLKEREKRIFLGLSVIPACPESFFRRTPDPPKAEE